MAYAKANPGKLNYGSAGVGSASHLGCVMLDQAMGTNAQHVPYRGTGPAMQDLIANQIQVMVDQSSNSLPQVRAGKIKAYAVTAKARSAAAPEIPTAAEAGYPMEVSIWHGLWAAKGTPADIIAKLNAAAVATIKDPDVRKRLEDLGQDLPTPEEMAPAALAAFHKEEYERWRKILEAANVKIE
jgi:tripartite-type tricarboxylate transporter receptor subunit TctC